MKIIPMIINVIIIINNILNDILTICSCPAAISQVSEAHMEVPLVVGVTLWS